MSSLCSFTICLSSCSPVSFECNETVDYLALNNISTHHSIDQLIDRVIALKGWEKKQYLLTHEKIGSLVAPDHGINLYLVDPEAKDELLACDIDYVFF